VFSVFIVILQYYNEAIMGVSKKELFDAEVNELALQAKAIAHPARIAILKYLLETRACINGDLVAELGLAQATISQHLRELKAAGLIQGSIEGTKVNYCIDAANWTRVKALFNDFFGTYDHLNNCC
jgi:DNA-binding transcriptional ArsR family regulator